VLLPVVTSTTAEVMPDNKKIKIKIKNVAAVL
jgi:hypothetical protein